VIHRELPAEPIRWCALGALVPLCGACGCREHPQGQPRGQVPDGARGGPAATSDSYGSRRGNDEIMTRGTFANIRLVNKLLGGEVGPHTIHIHQRGQDVVSTPPW